MSKIGYIKEDFVKTYYKNGNLRNDLLVFGDKVEILEFKDNRTKLRSLDSYGTGTKYVKGELKLSNEGCLKISMVDVQQGDGLILETPEGKVVFIDGGDNKLFARHAAARYQYKDSSKDNPMEVEAIIITHGDADHFEGLNEIVKSEKMKTKRKQLFLKPKRIYHNGLVKSSSRINNKNVKDKDRFGKTIDKNGKLYALDLFDDTRDAKEKLTNGPFKRWHDSINHWEKMSNYQVEMKRVAYGMKESEVFDFLDDEDIKIELLGPFTDKIKVGNKFKQALPFLHTHPDSPMVHIADHHDSTSVSASHTINGHSIAFRLSFGNVRMLFTGDLNKEALDRMLENVDDKKKLKCEILKAPHHGSHDFAVEALKTASPIVSIVSSGDQDVFHEHIHPRATLMSALGNSSRTDMSIIFSTELAAFFSYRKECYARTSLASFFKNSDKDSYTKDELYKLFSGVPRKGDPKGMFHGFERTNFGIIHLRTNGTRLLAFTHSGKKGVNEAYSYTIDSLQRVRSNAIKKR